MNNNDIQNNIIEIKNLYEKMLGINANLDECFSSITYLNAYFHEGIEKITQLSNANYQITEVNDSLNTIRKACEDFLLTFQLLHKFIWPRIFLSLETKDIFDSVAKFTNTTTRAFQNLDLGQMVSMDLIDSQLHQIDDIFEKRKASPSNKCITNWEFDINGLEDEIYNKEDNKKGNKEDNKKGNKEDNKKGNKEDNKKGNKKDNMFDKCSLKKCSKQIKGETKYFLKLELEATSDIEDAISVYKKQLLLLSALKHSNEEGKYKYVLPLLGGNISEKKVTCIYDYEDHMVPLLKTMKELKETSLNSYTKVAYEIAQAIQFLHSRSIAHGNINKESVIYILKLTRIDVFLFNFGLYTNNNLDSRPISFQTDIYQFGQLLYEMARYPEANLEEIKNKNYNYQNLDQYCSTNMINLIKDCLNENPDNRPTISEIVHRFQAADIFFKDKTGKLKIDKDKMIEYFNCDRFKLMKSKIMEYKNNKKDFNSILEAFNSILKEVEEYPYLKENTSIIFAKYINGVIYNPKKKKEDKEVLTILNEINFFERIIKFFDINDKNVLKKFTDAYIKVFQPKISDIFSPKSIGKEFLYNGGDEIIVKLLETGEKNNALKILDSIINYFKNYKKNALISTESLLKIIIELTKIKQLEYICKIIDLNNIETSVKIESISPVIDDISKLFDQPECKKYSKDIVKYFLQNSCEYSKSFIVNFKLLDSIKSGDLHFLRQLLKFRVFVQSITHADIEEAIRIFVSEESEQIKECVLLTFIGLDNEYFEIFSNFHQIIDLVINNPNQELASRFIARITQFSNASEYILSEIEKDTESPFNKIIDCQMPWYLVSLSRVALFFPDRISNIDQLKSNLIRNLNEMSNVEGTLRLLGVLSQVKDFWTDLKLAKAFIYFLRTNYLTQLEKSILLSVISNIISIEKVKRFYSENENYFEILFNAEVKGKDSGLCVRILSRLTVPNQPERGNIVLIQRLTNIIKDHLENGDKFGIEGSSHLIITMIDHYKETPEFDTVINCFQSADMANIIISKAKEEQDIVIFIKLMRSLNKLGIKSSTNITSMFSNMIMNFQGTIPNEFYDLRRSMCQ